MVSNKIERKSGVFDSAYKKTVNQTINYATNRVLDKAANNITSPILNFLAVTNSW